MPFFVYILHCADNSFYIGSTPDLEKRLHAHNYLKSGAHYTKIRRPVQLIYSENLENLHDARAREAELKRMSRVQKMKFLKEKGLDLNFIEQVATDRQQD